MFLDVGANNGLYSIFASKVRPDISVVAFEPYPNARTILRKNTISNEIDSNVKISDVVLSDKSGSVTLYLPDEGHGLLETSASLEPDFKKTYTSISVETKRFDDIEFSTRVSAIKVDIEGYEAAFFRGAQGYLTKDRPIIFAEMLEGASNGFYGLSKMLIGHDYFLFRLRPWGVISCSIIEYDAQSWNYGFVPHEKFRLFRDSCNQHSPDILKFLLINGLLLLARESILIRTKLPCRFCQKESSFGALHRNSRHRLTPLIGEP